MNPNAFPKLFLLFMILAPLNAGANQVKGGNVEASLFSDYQTVQPGQTFTLGVLLDMAPHWHTYWKNSGDSGGPTKIEWEKPSFIQIGDIQWPYPQKIETPPLVTYGYENQVMLLASAQAGENAPSGSFQIRARVKWLECADVCIPGQADLSIQMDLNQERAELHSELAPLFNEFRERLPLERSDWEISGFEDDKAILIEGKGPGDLGAVQFFPSTTEVVNYAGAQERLPSPNGFKLLVPKSDLLEGSANFIEGVLVSEEGWRGEGSEKALLLSLNLKGVSNVVVNETLWKILLFAFLGGMILNLMPCVLPVITLKILGLVRDQDLSPTKRRIHGLGYGFGVVSAFLFLAGLLLILKSTGKQLGWGFQLQEPIFVAFLSLLFVGLGASLWGFFEIGASLTQLGPHKKSTSFAPSIGTGILAVIVATPCVAPFMGVALGYALTQPAMTALLVFAFLGLGLAFPYIALAFLPGLSTILPKPGPWMDYFKKGAGVLLWGTALWLGWVFWIQTSQVNLFGLLVSWGLIFLACFVWGQRQRERVAGKSSSKRLGLILLLMTFGLGLGIASATWRGNPRSLNNFSEAWNPFDPETLEFEVQKGNSVFVDFTAAWCLTCQVNDRTVFSKKEVIQAFKDRNVILMKADWTSRDETITRALEKLGRSGVPVYAFYKGGSNSSPDLWPPILSANLVLEKLNQSLNIQKE